MGFIFDLQNLEDSMKRNVLRSVSGDTYIKDEELDDLFTVFKVNYLRPFDWVRMFNWNVH